jgi:signal transduction histidine kinase/ActR/RegA family two-component response regulator
MKSIPLRRRLFLLAAAGILPLVVMAAIGLYALFQQQREQGTRAALEITRALTTAVDGELRRTTSALQILATSYRIDSGEMERFYGRAVRAVESQPQWHLINVFDLEGRQVMNTALPYGAPLPEIIDRESYERVVKTGQPAVGFMTRSIDRSWGVPVRVPVVRNGELKYVLTAVVEPQAILDVLTRQNVPEDWVATVADARGIRVARSRNHAETIGTPPAATLARMMRSGLREGNGSSVTSEGESLYTAFSRSQETGWVIAIGMPPYTVEAAAWRTLWTIGGGMALSILLGALAALMVARSINGPMKELRDAAQALGDGVRVSPAHSSIREIQDVSSALTAAAEQRGRDEAEREVLLQREQAARAVAEAANRSKDEFLAMLGHELRNPLGAISNAASMLENPRADADAMGKARAIIKRQVGHLTRLTDDLLDAGRALMGKIVLRPQPTDFAAVAEQSLATLRTAGRLQNHRVEEDLDSAWVQADPIRLDQIVSNLVVNAVKYTPPNGTIRVSVKREGDESVLRVADNGIGIPPALAARAFELFVQGDRELDRSQGGLGIGLTLVRRLAEMHGGSAAVFSEGDGRGSELTVRLPAIEAREPETPAAAPASTRTLDILIVEDNDDARETLRILLEMSGHRIETARDGISGLEKALAMQPQVALLDVGLPNLDGYEVARRIRAGKGMRRPFLVALTGYGLPEDRERAFAAGFDAHLVKPVDIERLHEVLATSTSSLSEGGPR